MVEGLTDWRTPVTLTGKYVRLEPMSEAHIPGLAAIPEHRGLEIGGTWYGRAFRRTAVNTESKYLLLRHAFETLGCIRVQFKADLRNVRSQQAIERIGAVKEGVLRNHIILPDGRLRDSVFYSILDTEWP
ncbi:MAG: GNAT family N-acetyltransferase, partial [Chloroflexota bacterium]